MHTFFGSIYHDHGNVFHTVPVRKENKKKATQNYSSGGYIVCVHSITIIILNTCNSRCHIINFYQVYSLYFFLVFCCTGLSAWGLDFGFQGLGFQLMGGGCALWCGAFFFFGLGTLYLYKHRRITWEILRIINKSAAGEIRDSVSVNSGVCYILTGA